MPLIMLTCHQMLSVTYKRIPKNNISLKSLTNLQKITNDYDDSIFTTSANSDNSINFNNDISYEDFNNFHTIDEIQTSADVTSYLNSTAEDNILRSTRTSLITENLR